MILRLLARRRRRLLGRILFGEDEYVEVPEIVYNYAKRISEVTGLPLWEVLRSRPVRSYWERFERRVRIRLPRDEDESPQP